MTLYNTVDRFLGKDFFYWSLYPFDLFSIHEHRVIFSTSQTNEYFVSAVSRESPGKRLLNLDAALEWLLEGENDFV